MDGNCRSGPDASETMDAIILGKYVYCGASRRRNVTPIDQTSCHWSMQTCDRFCGCDAASQLETIASFTLRAVDTWSNTWSKEGI